MAEPEKKTVTFESPPEDKLKLLKEAAEYFNAGMTELIGRDDDGKLLFVSVHATGEDAIALERWLKRREMRSAPAAAPESSDQPSEKRQQKEGELAE